MRRQYTRRPLADRFWPKVQKSDGCWLWQAALSGGYGKIGAGPKGAPPLRAHRVSWELAHGPIPDGLWVLHQCDVNYAPGDLTYRRCVRPDHLRLGTRDENVREMADRGRAAAGVRNGATYSQIRISAGVRAAYAGRPELVRRGEAVPTAKLSAAQMTEIREMARSRVKPQREIARQFGVSQSLVSMIATGRVWATSTEVSP